MGSCILLVEDETVVLRAIMRQLRDGYTCTVARTVREAILALESDARWDGLIVDIGLPDGDGLDVVRAARMLHPGTPVLVATGNATPKRVNEVFTLRARLVVKPVRRWMLMHMLQPLSGPLTSMLACVVRHPERWDEAVVSYVVAQLESGEYQDIATPDWPDVLDDLAMQLRCALPPGIPRTRGTTQVH